MTINHFNLPTWASDYLSYLQVPVQIPSYAYLTELCTAHLNRVPFENISTLLHYEAYHQHGRLPDVATFVQQLVEQNMGGTCYTINSNLLYLLHELGFNCRFAKLGSTHMALLVQLPNEIEEMYVDCGTAAPLFAPVKLQTDPDNRSGFGGLEVHIRAETEPDTYTFRRYVDGRLNQQTFWSFDTRKRYEFADFKPDIDSYFQPDSKFTSTLRCQLFQLEQQRSLSLVNHVLNIRYSNGTVEKRRLKDMADIRHVINEEFNLPKLPVEQAISILDQFGVNIFA